MDNIRHLYTVFHFLKMMLMMPEAVWTMSLLINKVLILFHVSDFRHPTQGYPEHRL